MKPLYQIKLACFAIVIGLFFNGCSSVSYAPYISLEAPSDRINATIQIDDFTTSTPVKDAEKPFLGSAASNPESMPTDLGVMMTNELVKDFRINDFFKTTSKFTDDPDIILTGTIKRYSAKFKPLPAAVILFIPYVNIIAYFGIPIFQNEVIMEMQVRVTKRDKTSRVYMSDKEYQAKYNIYNDGSGNLQAATNRILINIIRDLRNDLIDDKEYLES